MKIISKFKDYYDRGSVYGIDKERVYIRETVEIGDMSLISNDFEIVGFCGKIYPLMNFSDFDRKPKDFILYGKDAITYTFIDDDNYGYKKIKYITAINKKYLSKYHFKTYSKYKIKNHVETFNDLVNSEKYKKIFLEYKVPVFYIGNTLSEGYRNKLILNPRLKDLAFYKVFDTVQAFQEIFMFIGNQLVQSTQGKVPVGNDEVIGNSKGFDRFSFRNINTKKTPKKF